MSQSGSSWDDLFCWVSGSDPEIFHIDADMAEDERRVARAYGIIILAITLINFICTALSMYEVFIQLREKLSAPVYIGLLVLPIAVFWSALVFNLLRLTIQAGYEHDVDRASQIREAMLRLAIKMTVLAAFLGLGFTASIPLQTAALSNDIRFAAVVKHWDDLGPSLLKIHLEQAVTSDKSHHPCVKPLMTPQIFSDLEASAQRLGECRSQVAQAVDAEYDATYSTRLLDVVRTHLYPDGLISRSTLAFAVAPGASWLLVLIMMAIFSAPYLTRLMARKRAYEYWRQDRHRALVAQVACIELHAHDAFDGKGRPVALHRYHEAENLQAQRREQAAHEQQEVRDELARTHEEKSRSLQIG